MAGEQSDKREKFEKEVAAHPFLLGMNEQHVRLLSDCAMHSHFHTDGIVFREGEAANRFYLIVRGKVRLESSTLGEPVPIDEIHDGDLLGWSWLFPPYKCHFTAITGAPTEVISCNAERLRAEAEKNCEFRAEMLSRVANTLFERLRFTRLRLIDSYRLSA